jgi:septal ring factor EnvC (AmiA/AmiB activator)
MAQRYLITVLLIVFVGTSFNAHAQERAPKHPNAELEQRRNEAEARKKELEKEASNTKASLADMQKELVGNAAAIKKSEERLTELDGRIGGMQVEQKEIEERLKKDRAAIGDLVLALERVNRTPPEAILAKPGAPLETAQSAMLLQSILPGIYGRAENLKKDLTRLEEIIKQLSADKFSAKQEMKNLTKKQAAMTDLLDKRKKIYAQTQTGIKEQEKELREISVKSANLRDLVKRIEERERERAIIAKNEAKKHVGEAPSIAAVRQAALRPTPIPKAGSPQLPVSGLIRVRFGQMDDIGAQSQGLTIEGRPGALVVSPMGGVVRYAGTFKNYGQIVIVEHQKDYHSLIAGLARIDTVVGQSVASGEPVGSLSKNAENGNKPSVYYELRHKGMPINPSRKFDGL